MTIKRVKNTYPGCKKNPDSRVVVNPPPPRRQNFGENYPRKTHQYLLNGFVAGEIFKIAGKYHAFVYPETGEAIEKDFKTLIPAKLFVAKKFHGQGTFNDPKTKYKARNSTVSRNSGTVKPRQTGRRGNPNSIPAELAEKARRFFKVFHWGIDPKSVSDIEIEIPEALVLLGELTEVSYLTKKGVGQEVVEWNHEFSQPYPKLYTTPDGKGLFIHGGNFKITRAGIEG